jgi:hypothetical protein
MNVDQREGCPGWFEEPGRPDRQSQQKYARRAAWRLMMRLAECSTRASKGCGKPYRETMMLNPQLPKQSGRRERMASQAASGEGVETEGTQWPERGAGPPIPQRTARSAACARSTMPKARPVTTMAPRSTTKARRFAIAAGSVGSLWSRMVNPWSETVFASLYCRAMVSKIASLK